MHPQLEGERYAKSGKCTACAKEQATAYKRANVEKNRAASRRWYASNLAKAQEMVRQAARKWLAANRALNKQRQRAAFEKRLQREPEKIKAYSNMNCSRRRAKKVQATPGWANQEIISCIYDIGAAYRSVGIDCCVDHIVPLRSAKVCGLHVEHNLTLLMRSENARKGNRQWPDMS